jgi:DNA-directed RNA polymerase subunit N
MIIPVRCFSCGTQVGSKFEAFAEGVRNGEDPKEVLDRLDLFKYCCRRMIISHIDLIDVILPYTK